MPIIKRRSWGFQNTPNLQSLDNFEPSYGNLKKIKISQNNFDWRFREGKSKHCFFGCAITWLKIMQILQVGGVFESSRSPLEDGNRIFQDWCILGCEIDKKTRVSILIMMPTANKVANPGMIGTLKMTLNIIILLINTNKGFQDHENIWGRRWLSSALL